MMLKISDYLVALEIGAQVIAEAKVVAGGRWPVAGGRWRVSDWPNCSTATRRTALTLTALPGS